MANRADGNGAQFTLCVGVLLHAMANDTIAKETGFMKRLCIVVRGTYADRLQRDSVRARPLAGQ